MKRKLPNVATPKPMAITKKHALRKKWLIFGGITVALLLATGLLTLRFMADSQAAAYSASQAAFSKKIKELRAKTAATSRAAPEPTPQQIAVLQAALEAFYSELKNSQPPKLGSIWLGSTLSQDYQAAAEKAAQTATNRQQAEAALAKIVRFMKYQNLLANALGSANLAGPIKDATSAEATSATWATARDTVKGLVPPAATKTSHDQLVAAITAVHEQLNHTAALYKNNDRDGLVKANEELALRLQSARALAEPLQKHASALDGELAHALAKF